jgi:hypothetical protein
MELVCVETGGRLRENVLADEVFVANSPKGVKVGHQVDFKGRNADRDVRRHTKSAQQGITYHLMRWPLLVGDLQLFVVT